MEQDKKNKKNNRLLNGLIIESIIFAYRRFLRFLENL